MKSILPVARQLRGQAFSAAQDTHAYTLLKECGHMGPGQPLNVVLVIGSQSVSGAFSPVLRAVHAC